MFIWNYFLNWNVTQVNLALLEPTFCSCVIFRIAIFGLQNSGWSLYPDLLNFCNPDLLIFLFGYMSSKYQDQTYSIHTDNPQFNPLYFLIIARKSSVWNPYHFMLFITECSHSVLQPEFLSINIDWVAVFGKKIARDNYFSPSQAIYYPQYVSLLLSALLLSWKEG